ncbi:MAG TPA: VIT1/CCC1 transporter family protein, partial [Chitinophagaceae bacterium]|nr:VIT1/CCC1 transporter family protein [Chitinophagaceae bacterium]
MDKRLLQSIQTEIDTAYLYQKLAEKEKDPNIAAIFREMSAIENLHANAFMKKQNLPEEQKPPPSFRAKTLNLIGRLFGYDYVLGVVMDTEKSLSNSVLSAKKKTNLPITGTEFNHVRIMEGLLEKSRVSGSTIARFESRHRSVGGNALRAAVLGGNDGLVSNFSLVMGVAGATVGQAGVLLAGSAGLLAGALSMALGEWISVKSSQELYENQMQLEQEELETSPELEMKELELIYMSKGIPGDESKKMAAALM